MVDFLGPIITPQLVEGLWILVGVGWLSFGIFMFLKYWEGF
jgi:hypothetical protein